jgi:ferredoxin
MWAGVGLAFVSLPWWWRPKNRDIPPSKVDIDRCTGCTQCYEDCPYDAISMIQRKVPSKLSETVADVNPDACVSCGICAASCAPMGIGPLMQDGRNQLRAAENFIAATPPNPDTVVVMGCSYAHTELLAVPQVVLYSTGCSGAVHTSVIELLIRRGYGGVYVLSCGPKDCNFREGPTWLEQRVFHDREAELKDRVDKQRVFIGMFSKQERAKALDSVREFQAFIATLAAPKRDNSPQGEDECTTGDAA